MSDILYAQMTPGRFNCVGGAVVLGREEEGGFNTRPPSWEVRQKVDRRRDRAIKLERGNPSADGDQ